MIEENFDCELISEHAYVGELPIFCTGRLSQSRASINSHVFEGKENQYENLNIQRMLKQLNEQQNKKKKQVNKKGWERGCEKKQVRLMQLREQKDRKELQNCTFQPNLHSRFDKPKRSLGQFLQEQQNFTKKVNAKKQMIKQHLDQKQRHQFKPNIHNYIDPSRSQKPIYERLYNLRNKEESFSYPNKEQSFRPSIGNKSKNIVRKVEIGTHLYQDALRRQSKKLEPSSSKPQLQKSVNLVNQKYVAQKFIKQLYAALEQMQFQMGKPLDYITFNQLFYRLGFVTSCEEVENKSSTAQRALVYQAYSLLSQTQATIKNVCLFLMALIGIYHIDPINFNGQEDDESLILSLDQTEGRKLQKHFDLLYRNRLYAEQFRKVPKVSDDKNYTFKPHINPESEILAQNFRSKILKQTANIMEQYDIQLPFDRDIGHAELLMLNKIGKDRIRQQIKNQQQEKELKQCTFKPNILDKKFGSANSSFVDNKSAKCLELYNLHKKRMSKDTIEESQKQKDIQCTFVPQISRKGRKSATMIPRDCDKQILRMQKSRKQKEQISKFLQRGYDKTKVDWKDGKLVGQNVVESVIDERQEQSPFLVIDVNLGSSVDQIVVNRSQINKAQFLAQSFSKKHNLDSDTKLRLVDLLQQQIDNVLQKIQEQQSSNQN